MKRVRITTFGAPIAASLELAPPSDELVRIAREKLMAANDKEHWTDTLQAMLTDNLRLARNSVLLERAMPEIGKLVELAWRLDAELDAEETVVEDIGLAANLKNMRAQLKLLERMFDDG